MESRQRQPASQETRLIVVSTALLLYSTRMVTLIVGIVNEGDKNQPLAYSKLARGVSPKSRGFLTEPPTTTYRLWVKLHARGVSNIMWLVIVQPLHGDRRFVSPC